LIGLAAAVFLLATTQIGTALAYIPVDSSGRTGVWSIADDATQAALRCTYDDQDLAQLDVSPPTVMAIARRRRLIGWQFQVLRSQWWRENEGHYYAAYTSPLVKAWARRSRAATFAPGQWTVPSEWGTSYDGVKVRVTIIWFAADGTTQIGRITIELEYHQIAHAGPDPPVVEGPGQCVGSSRAPVAPPAEPRAAVPAGFERMSHWQPYWKKFSEARVETVIADLVRMNQTGVILTGMESKHTYALPADVSHYLTMFRNAGIKPYLALWVSRFNDADLEVARRAWDAGEGKWAGIVLDVERGLEIAVETDRAAAIKGLDKFMAEFRPLTSFLAYSSFAYPTDHPDMLYSELNSYCDVFMPQLYFNEDVSNALTLLDMLKTGIAFESPAWSDPPIPVVPVVNDWGAGTNQEKLQQYIDISFARYGAVSGWRLHSQMTEETKALWASIDP
jgi:hypothetical protein